MDNCTASEPVLTSRSWKKITNLCRNQIVALKKKVGMSHYEVCIVSAGNIMANQI